MTETERRVANCFDRLELELRTVLAGVPLAKMIEVVHEEREVAMAAIRDRATRRPCGCVDTVPMDGGRCLGCGKILQ